MHLTGCHYQNRQQCKETTMSKDTSGSVFPTTHNGSTLPSMTGLTKREYFAGLAMQGMLCNGFIPNIVGPDGSTLQSYNYAECAFRMADAMLAEGSKQ